MIKAPCKSCEKKGCGIYHDKCERYQEYKNLLDQARLKEQAERAISWNTKTKRQRH